MKIALYDDRHFSMYGAQRVMVSLAARLQERGWEPTIITGADGVLSEMAADAGVPVEIVAIPARLDIYSGAALRASVRDKLAMAQEAFVYSDRIRRAVERLDSDVVVANALRPLIYCTVSRLRTRKPIVWFLQGGRNVGVLSLFASLVPHRIMTVSRGARQALPRLIRPLLIRRSFVNSPGIDLSRFDHVAVDRGALRDQFGLPRDAAIVVGVGSIEHRKGFDVLLRAVDLARSEVPDIHVVIAGSARGAGNQDYEASLRELCEQRSLPVTFLGWVDDTGQLLRTCDVFVLSSRQERFGLVTVEAMASGLPVIVTRADGSEEVIVEGQSGLLVEPDDPQQLAERIGTLMARPELRRRLAAGGRQRALEQYSAERFVQRFVAETERLVRSRR